MAPHDRTVELLILDFHGVCLDPRAGTIDPVAKAVVSECSPLGLPVAVLSNELDGHTIQSTPLLQQVDHVVSCTTGIQKPDRRAFERVIRLVGVAPEHAVVVDDQPINARGAQAAGAASIWFDVDDREASWASVRRAIGLAR